MTQRVMEYQGYQGSAEVSLADRVVHGKILHINDLVTYEAENVERLEEAFREAVDDYLEFCRAEGVEADKPYSGSFNIRIGPETHRRLAMAASRADMSLNDTLKRVLVTWLDECPDGFVVNHHHYHDHRISLKSGEVSYEGTVPLAIRPAFRTPVVRH